MGEKGFYGEIIIVGNDSSNGIIILVNIPKLIKIIYPENGFNRDRKLGKKSESCPYFGGFCGRQSW
jgi:hypothetical protein